MSRGDMWPVRSIHTRAVPCSSASAVHDAFLSQYIPNKVMHPEGRGALCHGVL